MRLDLPIPATPPSGKSMTYSPRQSHLQRRRTNGEGQGALKLILEPIFEADFQPGSYGYRPKKSAQAAVQRVSDAILQGKTYVIDLDLRSYFDTVRHHIVLENLSGHPKPAINRHLKTGN